MAEGPRTRHRYFTVVPVLSFKYFFIFSSVSSCHISLPFAVRAKRDFPCLRTLAKYKAVEHMMEGDRAKERETEREREKRHYFLKIFLHLCSFFVHFRFCRHNLFSYFFTNFVSLPKVSDERFVETCERKFDEGAYVEGIQEKTV